MKKVLFVCTVNRLRSPTAEAVFSNRPDIEVRSAGLDSEATQPLTAETVEWADLIFVMEPAHRNKLRKRFKASLGSRRLVCLDIPDEYERMDPTLIRLLQNKVPPHL